MNRELSRIALRLMFALVAAACARESFAQTTATEQKSNAPQRSVEKNKYQRIEVARFEVKEGVQFPENYMTSLMGDLVEQLQEARKFKQVSREGEGSNAGEPTILLQGVVSEFKPGNRALRYMVGPGVGKTKVVAQVRFLDKATSEVLYEGQVDGKVLIGVLGGDSKGATRGLAKEVAKVTKQKFF